MPTDFVFVDLSPVKNEDEKSETSSNTSSVSPMESPILDVSNDSISTISSEDCDSIFSSLNVDINDSAFGNNNTVGYMQENVYQNFNDATKFQSNSSLSSPTTSEASVYDQNLNLGLGIFNVDFDNFHQQQPQQTQQQPQPQPEQNANWMMQQFAFQQFLQYQCQFNQIQNTPKVQQLQQFQPVSPDTRRTKSASSIPMKKQRNNGFEFKTYKGPSSSVRKPAHQNRPHQRSLSASSDLSPRISKSIDLEDFMMLNKELLDSNNFAESTNEMNLFTPVSDYSESEEIEILQRPMKMDDSFLNQNVDDFLNERREFDLNAFISI